MVNSTGRKWEFTFTTLVTFGGAFFASFPLFYSTSFRWCLLAVDDYSYSALYCRLSVMSFRVRQATCWAKRRIRRFLVINGVVGPLLLGGAVATFFTGSDFYINKANMGNIMMPVISQWGNGWHGLDALT